jgi:hypothetical protein
MGPNAGNAFYGASIKNREFGQTSLLEEYLLFEVV